MSSHKHCHAFWPTVVHFESLSSAPRVLKFCPYLSRYKQIPFPGHCEDLWMLAWLMLVKLKPLILQIIFHNIDQSLFISIHIIFLWNSFKVRKWPNISFISEKLWLRNSLVMFLQLIFIRKCKIILSKAIFCIALTASEDYCVDLFIPVSFRLWEQGTL